MSYNKVWSYNHRVSPTGLPKCKPNDVNTHSHAKVDSGKITRSQQLYEELQPIKGCREEEKNSSLGESTAFVYPIPNGQPCIHTCI